MNCGNDGKAKPANTQVDDDGLYNTPQNKKILDVVRKHLPKLRKAGVTKITVDDSAPVLGKPMPGKHRLGIYPTDGDIEPTNAAMRAIAKDIKAAGIQVDLEEKEMKCTAPIYLESRQSQGRAQ